MESKIPKEWKGKQSNYQPLNSAEWEKYQGIHNSDELNSVWLKSVKSRLEKLMSLIKANSHKHEDVAKMKFYTEYYVSEAKLNRKTYNEISNMYKSLFETSEKAHVCNYFPMYVDKHQNQKIIIEFENQLKEIEEITQIFKEAKKIYMIYENITDIVYFLSFSIQNSGSNNATIVLNLSKVNGQQITDTDWQSKVLLNEMHNSYLNSDNNFTDFSSFSLTSEIYDLFSDGFGEYVFDEKVANLSMENVLQISRIENKTFQGEMLAHSYSNEDQIFWFVAAKVGKIYLVYFDINELNFQKQLIYNFTDSIIITSLTWGKDFVVYAKMFDEYGLRELVIDHKNNNFIEKWHSELREGVYESVFLTHFIKDNNIHILNSRIKEENKTKYIQLETSKINSNLDRTDHWIIRNQTLFKKELELYMNNTLKVDSFYNPYTFISDHSGKSFLISLNKVFSLSVDWNEEISGYQFFESFKYKTTIIDILANNYNNTIAFAYIKEKDIIYI